MQSLAKVNFFRNKKLLAESAQGPKRSRLAKNKRSGHPALPSAQPAPNQDHSDRPANSLIKFNRRAATETAAALNSRHHFGEQFGARRGIRVDKNQSLPEGCRRSGVTRTRDLIDGLENDASALFLGYFAGSVRRVIVANDDLMIPSELRKFGRRISNAPQGTLDKLLFVEGGDDDRD
jgi:hypothetical protein